MNSQNRKRLDNWLDDLSVDSEEKKALEAIWDASEHFSGNFEPDVEKGLLRFQQGIAENRTAKLVPLNQRRRVFQIAATIALLVVAGLSFYKLSQQPAQALIETTTINDEIKDFLLNDGTAVSLNANSKLSHPETFSKNKRELRLYGEAFFEVQRNESQPFQVSTKNILVEVLGTSFNIRDIDDEGSSEVYVKSGKVAVTVPKVNRRYLLEPGQLLILDKETGNVTVNSERTENSIAWKTRVLKFRNTPLSEIFTQMERLFDVEIQTKSKALMECPFTTTVRATKLRDAFSALEASCDLTFNITSPGVVTVSGECCNQ